MEKPDISNLSKKERKQFLREYRESQEKKAGFQSVIVKVIVGIVVIVVVGGIIFLLTRPPAPKVLSGEEISEQGRNHITQGSTQHEPYNSNPPTSGPHWPTPAECKIYDEPVPDEAAIHSMEHGAVWITYKDQSDKSLAENLKNIIEKNSGKILLSPRPQNDSKIALASWTRLLKLENLDEQQITDFIKNNRGNSPEPLASC